MARNISLLAFLILYIALVMARIHLAAAEDAKTGRELLASEAVKAPKIDEVKDV